MRREQPTTRRAARPQPRRPLPSPRVTSGRLCAQQALKLPPVCRENYAPAASRLLRACCAGGDCSACAQRAWLPAGSALACHLVRHPLGSYCWPDLSQTGTQDGESARSERQAHVRLMIDLSLEGSRQKGSIIKWSSRGLPVAFKFIAEFKCRIFGVFPRAVRPPINRSGRVWPRSRPTRRRGHDTAARSARRPSWHLWPRAQPTRTPLGLSICARAADRGSAASEWAASARYRVRPAGAAGRFCSISTLRSYFP